MGGRVLELHTARGLFRWSRMIWGLWKCRCYKCIADDMNTCKLCHLKILNGPVHCPWIPYMWSRQSRQIWKILWLRHWDHYASTAKHALFATATSLWTTRDQYKFLVGMLYYVHAKYPTSRFSPKTISTQACIGHLISFALSVLSPISLYLKRHLNINLVSVSITSNHSRIFPSHLLILYE